MKNIILIISMAGIFSACNPCKYTAKHPECGNLPDTIKLTEKVIHYETDIVIKDSIIRDTVPCDPTDPITIQKTVYQTRFKTIIDTIYTNKVVDRINPINTVLKAENEKLLQKNKLKGKFNILLGIILLLTILFFKIFK